MFGCSDGPVRRSTATNLRGGLATLCLAVCAQYVWALNPAKPIPQYILHHWRTGDGLSQTAIQAIAQTRDGYLWLGTRNGLVRFDGSRFTTYDSANTKAITHNNIADLAADTDGGLWIGSSEGGVVRWKDGVFTRLETGVAAARSVRSLLVAPGGTLWIGTYGGGIVAYKPGQTHVYNTANGLTHNTVRSLALARGGGVWAGTDSGLSRITDGHVVAVQPGELAGSTVNAIYDDSPRGVWAGTGERGLVLVQESAVRRFSEQDGLCSSTVRSLLMDTDGGLWIATSGGLNRWTGGRMERYTQEDGLPHNYVRSLFEDVEGALWVGLFGGGLARLNEGRFNKVTAREGLTDEFTFCVLGTRDGDVWIGTQRGGLNRLHEGKITAYTKADGLPSNAVLSLMQSSDGTVWVSTRTGVARLVNGTISTVGGPTGVFSQPLLQIVEAADGSLWGAGEPGLVHWSGSRVAHYPLPGAGDAPSGLNAVVLNPDGSLVTGGRRGLFRFESGRFTPIPLVPRMAQPHVHAIHRDRDGALWVATNGAGVFRIGAGRIANYSSRNGFGDDIVYQVLEDERDRLWFTSNRGVISASRGSLIDYAEGRSSNVVCSLYDVSDGMSSSECNGAGGGHPAGFRTRDGRLWFPTVRGVSVMDPPKVRPHAAPLPVLVQSVLAGRHEYLFGDRAVIPAGGGDVEIDFGGYSLLSPAHTRFSYKLEGFDEDWVEAGARRAAFYTRLPPGDYRFRVRAENREGSLPAAEGGCKLIAPPLFHQTVWFRGFLAAGGILLLVGVVRVREQRIRAREASEALRRSNEDLEWRVNQRTRQLAVANQGLRAEMEERQRAEESLRFTQASVDHASLAILWTRRDGHILRANRAAFNLFGYPEAELLSLDVAQLDAEPEAGLATMKQVEAQLFEHRQWTAETNCRRKDGTIVPVEVSLNLMGFEGNEYVLAFAHDITERKRLEAQLGQMQKMEAIGRLAGGIAHDFNNLLTVINGYSRMTLQSLAAGHPARPRIGHILEAGERASALTAQLMTFSRKQITQTRQMSLNDLVRDVSGLLRRLIREDVELEFVTAPGLCPVKADATQMQQVVMNLCLNARDAIQGAGRIRVETAEAVVRETVTPPAGDPVPPGEYAVLSVSDNGAGMDDFVLHHLFEPFFTTKDQGRGTGLGLPTVYGAVRQNGGYITVTSEVSKGTTVRMYLPRLEDEPSRQCSAEVAPAPPARERATVLLVEDEPQLRALARTILESSGYQVRDAPNGQAALEIARTQASFDLVVTDVVMPGMSGAELARRIRGADSTTRVLFMSGHARNHVSENDLDEPGTGYLQKPFSADDLLAAAGRLLTHESRSVRPPNRV